MNPQGLTIQALGWCVPMTSVVCSQGKGRRKTEAALRGFPGGGIFGLLPRGTHPHVGEDFPLLISQWRDRIIDQDSHFMEEKKDLGTKSYLPCSS